jgi:hypothetical protein
MFSLTEMRGQSSLLHKHGGIELNTDCYRVRRPVWLVMLKLLGVAAMIAVGTAIILPTLLELEFPFWQSVVMTVAALVIYTAVAFFVRPEANTDNLGWGGGMGNDPFQGSDNVNRILWRAHCILGPGRFVSETFLDVCLLVGLINNGDEPTAVASAPVPGGHAAGEAPPASFDFTRPIAPLDPSRFAQSSANFVAGQIQLDTQRFLASQTGPSNPPAAAN